MLLKVIIYEEYILCCFLIKLCVAVVLTVDSVKFCCCVTSLNLHTGPGLYKNVTFALNLVLAADFNMLKFSLF